MGVLHVIEMSSSSPYPAHSPFNTGDRDAMLKDTQSLSALVCLQGDNTDVVNISLRLASPYPTTLCVVCPDEDNLKSKLDALCPQHGFRITTIPSFKFVPDGLCVSGKP